MVGRRRNSWIRGWGVLSRFLSEACSNKSPTPLWLFNLRIRAFENKKGKHVVRPTRIAQLLTPSSSSISSSSSLEEREPQHPLTLFYLFYFLFFSSSRRKPSYGIYALFASIQCICMLVIMWWSEVCPKVLVVWDARILFPSPPLLFHQPAFFSFPFSVTFSFTSSHLESCGLVSIFHFHSYSFTLPFPYSHDFPLYLSHFSTSLKLLYCPYVSISPLFLFLSRTLPP